VSVVRPGAVRTPIFDKAAAAERLALAQADPRLVELYGPFLDAVGRVMARQEPGPVEPVVKVLVKAVEARRPKAAYNVGREVRMLVALSRLPARLRARILVSALRMGRTAAPAENGAR
jgi:hypothetical protein